MTRLHRILVFFVLLALISAPVFSQTVAFVGTENRTGSPELDYLGSIIEGLILFDLSRINALTLVERQRLNAVLEEQKLQLSGFTAPGGKELEAGRLLSAQYLARIDYTLAGEGDLVCNLSLTETETGRLTVFTSRGSQENEIHRLAEQCAKALTGRGWDFINPVEQRNLLTLRDVNPGTLYLYCNLENAEILLNQRFAGYTGGDLYTPIILDDLDPGTYTLTIRLGPDFGMVKLPEFTFHDWEEEVDIRPGRTTIHRSLVEHFNSVVYRESQLVRERARLDEDNRLFTAVHPADFKDRQGRLIPLTLEITGKREPDRSTADVVVKYDGREIRMTADSSQPEIERTTGLISITLQVDHYGGYSDLTYEIWRTDISQGMHRN